MEASSKETILPILQFKQNIIKTITDNPITIICGETGCGKTTQVPQYIIKSDPYANVIVTQPRRLAAISVAQRVAFQLGVKLGTLVGYHIGMDCKVNNQTRISYVTTGILLQKLTNDPKFLETYSHIIFDEVHQRGIECDFSLIAIKLNLCRKIKNNLRIIVMSATLNSELFSKFFARNQKGEFIKAQIQIKYKQKQVRRGDRRRHQSSDDQIEYQSSLQIKQTDTLAPCVILPTLRRFNITIKYLQDFSQNPSSSGETPYFDDCKVNKAIKLCQQNLSLGDILIFVPGMRQIKMISNAIISKGIKCKVFQLHSQFSISIQQLFAPTETVKIIISTNIAESSITLPDVKVIIDFCMSKQHQYNQKTNFQRLELVWASKASMTQRAGRVGRVSDGIVFRLICKNQYANSQEYDLSEMKRSSLQKTILRIKKLDSLTLKEQLTIFSNVYQVLANAFESPQVKRIDKTLQKLIFQQALIADESAVKNSLPKYFGVKLTMSQLGKYIVEMPCDIHLAKMLIVAATLGVHEQMIDIVAIMCYKKPFFVNFDKRQNPQNYVHNIFNYDENGFNDFSAKQRLFIDWMQTFYFPWKRNNFHKFVVKQKVQQNKEQQDMYYETYKNVLIDGSSLINNFISQKVDQKQIAWCTERCVWSNNFRDILSLRENIRAKVSRNLNINYPQKTYNYDIQNILELLCLFIGFKNNLIQIILERKSSYSIDKQQNKDLDISLLLTDVKFTEEDLYKFITEKSNTQFPKLNIKKTYSNIHITGGLKYLAKLRLPFKYRKTLVPRTIVSPVFSYLTTNQPVYQYSFCLKEKKHGRSVIVDDQSLNKAQFYSGTFQGYLLTNEFMESSRGLLVKSTAWISSDQTALLLMTFSQSVKLIWNKSQQFFTHLIADEIKYQLPFYLTKNLLATIQILRKTIKDIFDINTNKKIDYLKLISTITFLMDDCEMIKPLPNIQIWQELYAQQLGFKSRDDKYSQQIDKLFDIPQLPDNYHIKYKKWKRKTLKQMETQIAQFKYDYCILACKHCLPEINIVCTLDNIDKQKKIVIEKQSTSQWIVKDNQLYCRGSSGHNLGYIIDQNTPVIDCEKNLVLRYPNGQIKQVFLNSMDFKNIQNEQKLQKKWIKQKQSMNQNYECKVCYEQGYHHTEDTYNAFKKHTLKHRDKQRLFKQFM